MRGVSNKHCLLTFFIELALDFKAGNRMNLHFFGKVKYFTYSRKVKYITYFIMLQLN